MLRSLNLCTGHYICYLDATAEDTGEFEEEDDDYDDESEEEILEEDDDVEVETIDSEEFEVFMKLLACRYHGYHMIIGRHWNLIRHQKI